MTFPLPYRRYRRGFTLIELMIVIAVIAVLVSVALQAYFNNMEEAAKARCLKDLRFITDAARKYQAFEGEWPRSITELKGKYLANRESIVDPWGHPYQIDDEGPYSYGPDYIELSRHMLEQQRKRNLALAPKLAAALAADPQLNRRGDRFINLEKFEQYPTQSELLDLWGNYMIYDVLSGEVHMRGPTDSIIRVGTLSPRTSDWRAGTGETE